MTPSSEEYAPEWSEWLRSAVDLRDHLGILPTVHHRWLAGLASDWLTSPVTEILGRQLWPSRVRGRDVPGYLSFDWWSMGKRFADTVREKRYIGAAGVLGRFADGLNYEVVAAERGEIVNALVNGGRLVGRPIDIVD